MLEKSLVDNLYPGGWEAEVDGDFDNFNQATADNVKLITDEMEILACIRCPESTPVLSDLEREYGIVPNEDLTDEVRRFNLQVEKFKMESDGSVDTIAEAIHIAGFPNINVYENDPSVDPESVVGTSNFMSAGSDNSFAGYIPLAGEEEAICGSKTEDGYVLANGTLNTVSPDIDSVAGEMWAGDTDNSFAGHFLQTKISEILYPITDDPNRWAHFLFVGGTVVRNISGGILSVTTIEVPSEQRDILERTILKFKPIEKWCVMAIKYI